MVQIPDFVCGTCEGAGTITRSGVVAKCPSCTTERAVFDTKLTASGFTLTKNATSVTTSAVHGGEYIIHRNRM